MHSVSRRLAFNLNFIKSNSFSTRCVICNKSESNQFVEIKDISSKNGGLIRRITMINDKQRNTLSLEAIKHLQDSINSIDFDKYRVVILSAGKRHVFSSGHNLKELTDTKVAEEVFKQMSNLCASFRNIPLPTISEVYGLAAAGGCQLAASCDLTIASNKATFSTPGVKFGIFCTTPGKMAFT